MTKIGLMLVQMVLAGLPAFASPASASEEMAAKSRPAAAEDVVGEWHMVYQTGDPAILRAGNPFFFNHQWFDFSSDGYVKNFASSRRPGPESAAIIKSMPKKARFSVPKEGILQIQRSEQDGDNIVISIITADMEMPLRAGAPVLKKGQLVLSYMGPGNKPYMQRILERRNAA